MEKMLKHEGTEGTVREYILSFSSFYKAAYAGDMLEERGISSTLKKLPPELVTSCGTGLYLRTDSIQQIKSVLEEKRISTGGIFLIERDEKRNRSFVRIK